jgi:hypothetical protein
MGNSAVLVAPARGPIVFHGDHVMNVVNDITATVCPADAARTLDR